MKTNSGSIIGGIMFLCFIISVAPAGAHCDTMNGPVITAAENALKKGDVKQVLIWVQPKDEALITELFNKTLEILKNHPEVQELARSNFYENLVRIHRAGEGESYTGIKDVHETEPPIAAADKALESGNSDEVLDMLKTALNKEIDEKFRNMMALKNFDQENVGAGREFVESYVAFLHYVENVYNTLNAKTTHHAASENHQDTETQSAVMLGLHAQNDKLNPNNHMTNILIIGFAILIIGLQIFSMIRKSH